MGQQRPVTIHKMCIKNSIEERIAAVVKRRCSNSKAGEQDDVAAAMLGGKKRAAARNATIAGSLKVTVP